MLSKVEHINFWFQSSQEDWKTVESLFEDKRYVHCLFFAHLTLEKLCKANWVKDNENNIPPRIHNLVKILQTTTVYLEANDLMFLEEFNDFQLEGRYPDYLFEINKRCTQQYTQSLLDKVEKIKICLQKNLQ